MSDIGFRFSWWVFFFIPPIVLADALGWWTVPLAIVVAAVWLAFWRRRLDALLLGLAVVATIGCAWAFVPTERGQLVSGSAAIFVWLAILLLPVRLLLRRFAGPAR